MKGCAACCFPELMRMVPEIRAGLRRSGEARRYSRSRYGKYVRLAWTPSVAVALEYFRPLQNSAHMAEACEARWSAKPGQAAHIEAPVVTTRLPYRGSL